MKLAGLGISTNADMINGDDEILGRHLGEIADAGCSHAELILHGLDVVVGGRLQPSRVRRVHDVLRRSGLRFSIHLPYTLNLMDPKYGEPFTRIFEAGLDFADTIGAEVVVYHSSWRQPESAHRTINDRDAQELLLRDRDTLRTLGERAARSGVDIGVENNAWTDPSAITYGLRPADIVDHVRQIELDNVGITLDFGHLHLTSEAYGWDFADECRTVLPYLKHVHAHDNFAVLEQTGIYNRDFPLGLGDLHLPMGWGSIAWPEILPLFADYDGIWMMEIEYRLASLFPEIAQAARGLLNLHQDGAGIVR
ncbi:sugar phosphate isomerase/epimerase family protein [Microbacterium rhizosphaerae]|uniref:Sugar phosphate isomerase/epimerase n=1 Tax=Microbacterium rhizosphaerae TaxID=1678237 RepID=A0ABZ0SR09_9MICO|nr:sugar phosphate isomerase/epimerase [Microbacterium rhizosphaerae]WPR89662.1 sugar phosphate isomerase/epimerase [Microbacterium rhizosphaerae]